MSKHNWLISNGWTFHPQEPSAADHFGSYTHPKDFHYTDEDGDVVPWPQSIASALDRQQHMDHCRTLRKVRALFGWKKTGYTVRDVYIVSEIYGLIGNTDGYDDWGHYLKYSPGEQAGKQYDYIDIGA